MKDWRPTVELERLLDALEAELLSATDEEIREALGRRQPTRLAAQAISDAVTLPDTIGWPAALTSLRALDPAASLTFRQRTRADQ